MIKNQTAKKHNGFTLVETLLYVSITATILVVITGSFSQLLQIRSENRARRELQTVAEFVSDSIEKQVINADAVVLPLVDATSSTLEVDPPNQPNNVTITESANVITLNDNVNPAADLSNSDVTISNLQFTHRSEGGSPSIIDYSFDISSSDIDNTYTYTYHGAITIRR